MNNQEKLIRFLHQGLNQEYRLTDWRRIEDYDSHSVSYDFCTPCGTVTVRLEDGYKLAVLVDLGPKIRETHLYNVVGVPRDHLLSEVRAEIKLLLGTKQLW